MTWRGSVRVSCCVILRTRVLGCARDLLLPGGSHACAGGGEVQTGGGGAETQGGPECVWAVKAASVHVPAGHWPAATLWLQERSGGTTCELNRNLSSHHLEMV